MLVIDILALLLEIPVKARLHVPWFCMLVLVNGCVILDMDTPVTDEDTALRPSPQYPGTDGARGDEGWVLVAYEVSAGGLVTDPHIVASSGRSSFERAALKTIGKWRHVTGGERHTSVLVVFALEGRSARVSKDFWDLHQEVQALVDAGNLDAADTLLDNERTELHSPYEVAFVYLARARIAGHRADLEAQLQYYRQAMLYEGRWLAPENYRACLRASVMLAIMLEDYATAVRDYELLANSGASKDYLADLEDSINAARSVLEQQQGVTAPFSIADTTVEVIREPRSFDAGEMPRGPPNQRGATPPVRPRTSNQ